MDPGHYNLVFAKGRSNGVVLYVRVGSGKPDTTDITQMLNQAIERRDKEIEARERASALPPPRQAGALFGLLVDVNGAVIPAVELTVRKAGSKKEVARATSDDLGRFSFDLRPGSYVLRASKPGFYKANIPIEITQARPVEFEHGIGITLEVAACDSPIQPYRLHDLRKDCPAKPCTDALTSRRY